MTTQAIIIESGKCFDQRIRIVRTGREPPSWRDFQMVCPCVYILVSMYVVLIMAHIIVRRHQT